MTVSATWSLHGSLPLLLAGLAHLIKEYHIPLEGFIRICCIPASSPCARGRGSQAGSVVLEHTIRGQQDSLAMHDPLQCVIPAYKAATVKQFHRHERVRNLHSNLTGLVQSKIEKRLCMLVKHQVQKTSNTTDFSSAAFMLKGTQTGYDNRISNDWDRPNIGSSPLCLA